MNRDGVTKLLKNYRSYRRAIQNFETFRRSPAAPIASYSGMPSGQGAPELFFASVGRMADMSRLTTLDYFDYERYRDIVHIIDTTVEDVLSDDERYVIKRRWMDRNPMTLYRIAEIKGKDESTIRRWHREALRKLALALAPIPETAIPTIEEIMKTPA